jgi:hypothetical protein
VQWAGHPDITSPDLGLQFYVVRETGIYKATRSNYALEIARANAVIDPAYMTWPLKDGKSWGDPAMTSRGDGMYVWLIVAVETVNVPAGAFQKCFKAAMYTNPDTTFEWFCPGKGLARYEYHHHGSVDDEVWQLASFEPGS